MGKQRILWIDVLKGFGIFLIYIGHLGESAGQIYSFVWGFHVPLFFFISGCMESLNEQVNIVKNIKKKLVTLMIPFYFFALISITLHTIGNNISLEVYKDIFLLLFKGAVRNSFIARSLWFLSCLFITSVLFELIKKVKNRLLLISICLAFHFLCYKVLYSGVFGVIYPSWFYNVDSAFIYLPYYCLGYVFPLSLIDKILSSKNKKTQWIVYLTGGGAFIYTVVYFFGKNLYAYIKFASSTWGMLVIAFLTAITMIWFFIILSWICRRLRFFSDIGKNTLFLCGNEHIVHVILPNVVGIVGLQITITNPIEALVYTTILLCIVNIFIVPTERRMFISIKSRFLQA